MSAKTNTNVLINGKVYKLSGYEGEEYLQKVASYINDRIKDVSTLDSYRYQPADMRALMVELNISDDYFKAKAQVEKLERETERKDKEIYDLKHDLIATQLKLEKLQKELKEGREQMEALTKENASLTAGMEDMRRENSTPRYNNRK